MIGAFLLAAVLLTAEKNGVSVSVEGETKAIDPAKSLFLTLKVVAPRDVRATPPDLRERARGFSLAEDFAEEPVTRPDGSVEQTVNWKLVPEPCAQDYRLAAFVVTASPALISSASEEGSLSLLAGPLAFDPPPPRESVAGPVETDPQKDLPPFSWKLVGRIALALLGFVLLLAGIWFAVRHVVRRVKEHRMSPIERAWVELDRLLKKGLPGRGRYKDFYVELTMVVRRYVQRKYGIRAPHLTTEEFFAELARTGAGAQAQSAALKAFLESADMVKFAGVEATPDMADAATDSARGYLKDDAATPSGPERKM